MARLTIDRRAGVRGALLFTLPGRAIVVGVALKLAVFVAPIVVGAESPFLSVVDRVAGLAVAAGAREVGHPLIDVAKHPPLVRVRPEMRVSHTCLRVQAAL